VGKKKTIVHVCNHESSACDGVVVNTKVGYLEEKRDVKDLKHLPKPASNKPRIIKRKNITASFINLLVSLTKNNGPSHLPTACYNSQLKCLPSVSVDVWTLKFRNVMGQCLFFFNTRPLKELPEQ
jgi:hypothetical protein